MMRQSQFLMKYKEKIAVHSWDYGQDLRRWSSQKLACPLGVRLECTSYIVKILARGAGHALRIFPSILHIPSCIAPQKYYWDRFI